MGSGRAGTRTGSGTAGTVRYVTYMYIYTSNSCVHTTYTPIRDICTRIPAGHGRESVRSTPFQHPFLIPQNGKTDLTLL